VIPILGVVFALQAATVQVVPDCRDCERSLAEVVRLGDIDGPGAIGHSAWVTRMSDGRWALTDYQDPTIKVYARDGSYSGRFGRKGQGPGEFELPAQVWTDSAGDLRVMDLVLLRCTVISPRGELRRLVQLDADFTTVAAYKDGRFVTGALLPVAGGELALLHVVEADGRRIHSIGPTVSAASARTMSTFRVLAASGDTAVWVGLPDRYELQLYSLSGALLRTVRRQTAMFRPHDGRIASGPEDGPPRPRITDIQEQPNGELWILLQVPDPEWRSAFVDGKDPYGQPRKVVGDPGRHRDGILEVIDLQAGAVTSQARSDEALEWFAGPRLVAGESQSPVGVPEVVVFQLAGRD